MKLEELTSVICTSLIKSKSCLNKSSDKVNYTDKTELKQSSALLSDHLVSVQQEFNKWISLHVKE